MGRGEHGRYGGGYFAPQGSFDPTVWSGRAVQEVSLVNSQPRPDVDLPAIGRERAKGRKGIKVAAAKPSHNC
jgi:hypothetical protein